MLPSPPENSFLSPGIVVSSNTGVGLLSGRHRTIYLQLWIVLSVREGMGVTHRSFERGESATPAGAQLAASLGCGWRGGLVGRGVGEEEGRGVGEEEGGMACSQF